MGGQQTCDKLKKSECIHALSLLENGRLAFAKRHAERERLHVSDRPEESLLLRSTALKISEVHPVLLGRSVIQIPFLIRLETNSMNFYKASTNPNSDSTKNQHSDHRQPGRYADIVMFWMTKTTQGLNMASDTLIFLLQQLRFIINLKKSLLSATQKIEFLGLEIDSFNVDL